RAARGLLGDPALVDVVGQADELRVRPAERSRREGALTGREAGLSGWRPVLPDLFRKEHPSLPVPKPSLLADVQIVCIVSDAWAFSATARSALALSSHAVNKTEATR